MQTMRNYARRIIAYGLAVTMMIPGIAGASALGADSSTAYFATPVAAIGDFLFERTVARNDAASNRSTIAQPVVRLAAHTEHDALMIGALHTTDRRTVSAVELHNTARQFAPLSDVALVVSVSTNHTDYTCRVNLQGYAPPQSSVRYYHPAVAPADGAQLQGCPSVPDGEQVTRYDVVLERSGATIDKASAAVDELAGVLVWERATQHQIIVKNMSKSKILATSQSTLLPIVCAVVHLVAIVLYETPRLLRELLHQARC